jgi:hypothetical protein
MSAIFVIPILMVFLSVTLKYPAVRVANLIIGVLLALFDLVFLILPLFPRSFSGYESLWSFAYLFFTALVFRYAWTWPCREA